MDNKGFTNTTYNYANYLITPSWLMNSQKVGYWLPVEQSLRLSRSSQSNSNWANTATVSGTFATAWINHGKGPKNATYSYIMKMNTSRTEMSKFDEQMQGSSPPFNILVQTDKIHAVESTSNNTYSAVVINATSNINLKDVVSVSKPCVFMVKTLSTNQKKLSISYPDLDFIDKSLYTDLTYCGYSNSNIVQIKLLGNWFLASPVSPNVSLISQLNNVTTIQFVLKDGLTKDAIITNSISANDIVKNDAEPNILVYPNQISITLPDNGWSNASGQILSIDGKVMNELKIGKSITKVSTDNFAHGVYLISLKINGQVFVRKVII